MCFLPTRWSGEGSTLLMMQTQLDERQIRQLHQQLLKKGTELNEKLVQLLSGERVELESIVSARPGERPVERLRRFLDLIDSKIQATRRDSPNSYGFCELCGTQLPFSELEQMPWAERCRSCADKP